MKFPSYRCCCICVLFITGKRYKNSETITDLNLKLYKSFFTDFSIKINDKICHECVEHFRAKNQTYLQRNAQKSENSMKNNEKLPFLNKDDIVIVDGTSTEAKIDQMDKNVRCRVKFEKSRRMVGVIDDRIRSPNGKVLLNHEFKIGMKVGVLNEQLHPASLQLAILDKYIDETIYLLKFTQGEQLVRAMRNSIRLKESYIETGSNFEQENFNQRLPLSTPYEPICKRLRPRNNDKVSDYKANKNERLVKVSKPVPCKKKKNQVSIGRNVPNEKTGLKFKNGASSVSVNIIQNDADNKT